MNIIIIMIFSWFVYHFLCLTGFITFVFEALFVPVKFSPNKRNPGSASDGSSGELTAKQPTVLGASETRHPSCHGYIPPLDKENRTSPNIKHGGFFFRNWGDSSVGFSEIPIKFTWAAWHLLMFRFFVFFFGSFFVGGCKFWLLGPPALISIGGKSLYSLLASTLPIKLHQCLSTCEALLRRMCPRLGPQFPKEHVGLVLVYQRSWGVLYIIYDQK